MHDNEIGFVHENVASVEWKPAQPAMLRKFRGAGNTFSEKHFGESEKIVPLNSGKCVVEKE